MNVVSCFFKESVQFVFLECPLAFQRPRVTFLMASHILLFLPVVTRDLGLCPKRELLFYVSENGFLCSKFFFTVNGLQFFFFFAEKRMLCIFRKPMIRNVTKLPASFCIQKELMSAGSISWTR